MDPLSFLAPDTAAYLAFGLVLVGSLALHVRGHRRRDREAMAAAQRAGLVSAEGPRAQHPHIDTDWCIGCAACVSACPEGDVLAVIGGKAAMINGHKCIGHGLCADVCPVGAIEIVMAPPSMSADLPMLSAELETSVPHLFVAGELGGLALIKNAINQGRDCVDRIATLAPALRGRPHAGEPPLDLVIVGCGPAGLSASLRAVERGLSFVTLEAEELGGTVAKYPRQKLVMTSPVEFPLHGKFDKLEITKEKLLALWTRAAEKTAGRIRVRERVETIQTDAAGRFTVRTPGAEYRAHAVVLAIGRRGTPRKLGIPGEEQAHVMYSLLDAEAYRDKAILVVGGGDSAIEAAMGLAHQPGNRVTISYRKAAFSRLKERNRVRLDDALKRKELDVIFDSQPIEIRRATALLQIGDATRELAADYVWVFAGGTPPKAFLSAIGIAFGRQDLTGVARSEAGELSAA